MSNVVKKFSEFIKGEGHPDPVLMDMYDIVFEEVEAHLISAVENTGIKLIEIALIGSRVIGNYTEMSDVDILVAYDGNDTETKVCDVLNKEPLYLDDYKIDYIPLQAGRYGPGVNVISKWLASHTEYQGVKIQREII